MVTKGLKDLTFHEYANLFPMLDDSLLDELVEDIRTNGLMNPITLYEGQVLDGRNRYTACLRAGVPVRGDELPSDVDPLKFVASQNLHRRHLDTSQRSMVAAKMANLKRGDVGNGRKVDGQNCLPTEDAAALLNVSERSVKSAKQVLEHGSAELVKAVERGELPVSVASQLAVAEPSKETQTALVKQGREAIKEHVAEKTPKAKADTPKQKEVARCSSAMEFATMAICQLERIQPDDEMRVDALDKVVLWCQVKRGEWL
jgi:hypothetical protein